MENMVRQSYYYIIDSMARTMRMHDDRDLVAWTNSGQNLPVVMAFLNCDALRSEIHLRDNLSH